MGAAVNRAELAYGTLLILHGGCLLLFPALLPSGLPRLAWVLAPVVVSVVMMGRASSGRSSIFVIAMADCISRCGSFFLGSLLWFNPIALVGAVSVVLGSAALGSAWTAEATERS